MRETVKTTPQWLRNGDAAPTRFYDISLWLAVTAIILATSELISPHYGQTSLIIEKGHLRRAALILGLSFLSTVQ